MMRKTQLLAVTAAVTAVSLLTACFSTSWKETDQSAFPVTVENVTVLRRVNSVASLSSSITQELLSLDYQERIIGYTDDDVLPKTARLTDLEGWKNSPEGARLLRAKSHPKGLRGAVPSNKRSGAVFTSAVANRSWDCFSSSSSAAKKQSVPCEGKMSVSAKKEMEDVRKIPVNTEDKQAGDRPVSGHVTFGAPEQKKPKVPRLCMRIGTSAKPDMKKIIALRPELLLTNRSLTKAEMTQLDKIEVKVLVLPDVTDMNGLKQRLQNIAAAMDGKKDKEAVGWKKADELSKKLSSFAVTLPKKKSTFLYLTSASFTPESPASYPSELLSLLGDNVVKSGEKFPANVTETSTYDPDMILYSAPLTQDMIYKNKRLSNLRAVKNKKLIAIDRKAFLTTNGDVIGTLQKISKRLYPKASAFSNVSAVPSDKK